MFFVNTNSDNFIFILLQKWSINYRWCCRGARISTDGRKTMERKSLLDQQLQLPVHVLHGNILLDTPFGHIVNTAETPQSLTSYIKGRSAAVWREISGLRSRRMKELRTRRQHPQNSIQWLPLIWTVLVIITFIAVHHKHSIAQDTLTTCEFVSTKWLSI